MTDQTSQQAADQIAFEKWYLQERKQTAVRSAISGHTEHYVSISVATEWEVWQAALKHAQQAVESERENVLEEVAQALLDAGYGEAYEVVYKLQSQQPAKADKDKP